VKPTGVLGLQGDFDAHGRVLSDLGAEVLVVKKPEQLDDVAGLVMPGGESTTLIKLMEAFEFWDPLRDFAASGKALLGTCAGMILLADKVTNPPQKSLKLIDVDVERNSYGRQAESFEGVGRFTADGQDRDLAMIFIRAPRIQRRGADVECLATCGGDCVMARQGRVVVASFHPELTGDPTVHQYFLDLTAG